jgi:hypothetical protein
MFGIFKKNKKKTPSKKPAPAKTPKTQKQVDKMTNNQVLSTINQLQKELDRLKLAVTGSMEHEVKQSGKITESALQELQTRTDAVIKSKAEKIIEGVFDGQNMIGADGQQYDVPANYASKSKLVEGDILKLTIGNRGNFIFKQIKPIERERRVGILEQDDQSLQFYAVADGKKNIVKE